jgi:hypothetical protein
MKKRSFVVLAILVVSLMLLAVPLAFAGAQKDGIVNWATDPNGTGATESNPIQIGNAPQGAISITQSVDPNTVAAGAVACSPDGGATTTENSYWRVFDLPTDFGINNQFDIDTVQFGVEASGSVSGFNVNIYTLNGPFTLANLTLISSTPVTVPDLALALINAPVSASIPAGSVLVVELESADLSGVGRYFVGSNAAGENDPSYLSSGSCGITNPATFASIGFPNIHIVMTVSGDEVVGGNPSVTLDKTVGTDPNACAVTDSITVPAGMGGTWVTYCYTATNTGDVDLTIHDLDDSELGNIFTSLSYTLTPASSVAVTVNALITQTTVNDAMWTAWDDAGAMVTATDSATVNQGAPTSVSLSNLSGESSVATGALWLAGILMVVVGFGFAMRRKLFA